MTIPDDLPWYLEYRVGKTVRGTCPRQPVQFVSSSGATNAAVICPTIPAGADAWRLPDGKWKSMKDLPPHWLPFLIRQRPSSMDPRSPKG